MIFPLSGIVASLLNLTLEKLLWLPLIQLPKALEIYPGVVEINRNTAKAYIDEKVCPA